MEKESKLINYFKELREYYSLGFILWEEVEYKAIVVVADNLNSISEELPKEMIEILRKYNCGLEKQNFDYKKWSIFFVIFFNHPELNWNLIENDFALALKSIDKNDPINFRGTQSPILD